MKRQPRMPKMATAMWAERALTCVAEGTPSDGKVVDHIQCAAVDSTHEVSEIIAERVESPAHGDATRMGE